MADTIAPIEATIPTKGFVRANSKSHEAMLASLILDNSYGSRFCSDTSGVDFGKYRKETMSRSQIPCLREIFCDNIMLFMLVPSKTISGKTTSVCGLGASTINMFLREFLETRGLVFRGGARAKRTIDLAKSSRGPVDEDDVVGALDQACTRNIRKILSQNPCFEDRYNVLHPEEEDQKYGYVSYKVSFSQYSYRDAIDFCTDYADRLGQHAIYFHEIDFTADFACSFNKKTLAKHIESTSRESGDEYLVLDNDRTVGLNCLSFMHVLPRCVARCKVYNKFVQSLETRNVTARIGMHLDDWINNKEEQLRESIQRSLEHGFTRLEITFYSGKLFTTKFYEDELEHLGELALGSGKMFCCPIGEQWRAFTESLTSNMAIIDLDTKEYALGMWCNTLTRRVGGVFGTLTERQAEEIDRVIEWIAAHFSYDNGIINIGTVQSDPCPFEADTPEATKWSPTATLKLRSFAKDGDCRMTFVPGGTAGCLTYSSHISANRYLKTERKTSPQAQGLQDCDNVQLQIFHTRKVLLVSPLECRSVQVAPASPTILTNTKRQRRALLETEEEQEGLLKSMAQLTLQNKQIIADATKQIASRRAHEAAMQKYKFGIASSLSSVAEHTLFSAVAFKQYNGAYGSSYILLDSNYDAFRANAYITKCIDNNKHLVAFDAKTGTYYAPDYGVMFTFLRGADQYTAYGNLAASVSQFRGICFTITDAQEFPSMPTNTFVEISSELKHKDLTPIDNLLLETTYVLQGISKYEYRKKLKYIVLVDDTHYSSNYWLEQNLETVVGDKTNYEILLEGGVKTHIRTHFKATTPQKKVQLRCTAL